MTEASRRIFTAMRNLREVQPGFSSTTPGNGSPGGGSGGSTSITERLAGLDQMDGRREETGIGTDDALRDKTELERDIAQLERLSRRVYDRTIRWGYATAGEFANDHTPAPNWRAGEEPEHNRRKWCTSCERLRRSEPVFRGELCKWCYDFNAAEKELPPPEILDAKHRGVRITTAVLADWRRERAMTKAGSKAKGKKKGRAGVRL